MKCPVCGKEARVRLYHCGRCGVYVHTACWEKHARVAHKKRSFSNINLSF